MGTAGAITALGFKVGLAAVLALGAVAAARCLCRAGIAFLPNGAAFRLRERRLRVVETVSVGQH